MLAVERTHRLRADRDWLPRRVRNARVLVTGGVWAGAGVATLGAVVVAPAILLLWKGMLLGGAGLAFAGDRAGRAMMQRQLRRMTRGEVELTELRVRPQGELVVVRGTIEVAMPLRGVLVDARGVFRRLVFAAGGTWVHEAAVDFALLDDAGHRVLVRAAGARWLVPEREKVSYPAHRFAAPEVPPRVQQLTAGREWIQAIEQVLGAGEQVQLVGYKTTSPDASGDVEAVDYRTPPQRATLSSGPDLPLVITRLADLES